MKTLAEFKQAFPGLYDHPKLIDFSLPPGWVGLVWLLSEKLEPLGVRVVQVKEKFGELRFYTDLATQDASPLVQAVEAASGRLCQECGKPGTLAKRGHLLLTCCDQHLKGGQRMTATPYGFEPVEPKP